MGDTDRDLHNFWESNFQQKQQMWGLRPASAAVMAAAFFKEKKAKSILIPGFGYGRNAIPFLNNGMQVTGIEISATAISLAKKHFANRLPKIFLGSTAAMPYEQKCYDGIFCYSLIHLLDPPARVKLIQDCFNQLSPGGYMIFVSVSRHFPSFGKGRRLGENWYETMPGVQLYFYDHLSIENEFGGCGLVSYEEITESDKDGSPKQQAEFWYITCKK